MIQELSARFQKGTATLLFTICFNGMILPSHAFGNASNYSGYTDMHASANYKSAKRLYAPGKHWENPVNKPVSIIKKEEVETPGKNQAVLKPDIGGPSQPEMSAFKSVGTDNMVNLFTGDFSYNIPLLDVGGYPVNIFYDGGVSMEQEASWVGLGWNINPGNVNRNMRGIPDDFDGKETLTQTQDMKRNLTWGVTLGADMELVGIKKNPFAGSVGASFGVSFNNYLGPALDLGIRGATHVKFADNAKPEKGALTLGGGLSINASSRSGVTFSPSVSLSARANADGAKAAGGFGFKAATSYNSKSGIKEIQLSEQMTFNRQDIKMKKEEGGWRGTKVNSSIGANIGSSSISFVKPSYIPSMRMPLTNSAFSGHFQLGTGIFGAEGDVEVEAYRQVSEVADADRVQKKPMVGYLYLQNANGNANAVMDFTRVNDNEVTPTTPIISAPQYSYDVFSIQGEGTGGSIRAYRNDEGYVRDNFTMSKDKSVSIGGDVDAPGHYGGNFNKVKTPSTIGEWNAGNKLRAALPGFTGAKDNWENVYFRNPGESGVVNPNQYDRIGGIDLVRYKLGGTKSSPTIEPVLEKFVKSGQSSGTVTIPAVASVAERKKRTQVISFLNAKEASQVGLDKMIKSYDRSVVLTPEKTLNFQSFARYGDGKHNENHISQINVTEANGQRYIYGIPVYNLKQKDFTFSVKNPANSSDPNKVDIDPNEAITLNNNKDKDGYLQITETPAYAHSFLLSGLLSPDYVDVSGDGITEDDLGNAVKFNYTKMSDVSRWRTPLTDGPIANFLPGKRTEEKDDKGAISYGERESWYMHSIESKTMIALFTLENRHDGKGANASSEIKDINSSDNSAQRLKEINLYSKADLKKNGLAGAKPIKTVHFDYNYTLCKGVTGNLMPGNPNAGEGKLTLERIWFTFNGQNRLSKNQYVFSYGKNPEYKFNASDRWGTYKDKDANPQHMENSDFPYSMQDNALKASVIDPNAGAWMLNKILLPSGGQMEVTYESDDYAFVQNKRAASMMQIVGFGSSPSAISNELYTIQGNGITENDYAFIQVPVACNSVNDIKQKYLSGIEQLSFKLAVTMPKGTEFINSYATIEDNTWGIYEADVSHKTIWIKLKEVDLKSPLSLTSIEFLREQLPGQANPGYDVTDENTTLAQIGDMLAGWLDGIKSAFTDPVKYLRQQSLARYVDASRSFVRLNDPDGVKFGGGHRVKSIRLKDNWKKMNNDQLYNSEYGQDYNYKTTEIFNGELREISSGVASYEPSLGGDENPFQTMIQVQNNVPLGPTSYGAVEMPVLDAFFPAPVVGYSKVTVTSVKKDPQGLKSRSGIGKQVTEFYTAKDYPVYCSNTSFDPSSDVNSHASSFGAFFYKYAFDSRALSQGFLVETNDMHGKMKSQSSYREGDDKTLVNYTENFYKNTGSRGLDDKVNFVYANQGGAISQGNLGVDVELMTDTREFSVKGSSIEIQAQVDWFPIFLGLPWLPFVWPVSGNTENTYRAVTATKVVSYHSILDKVVVIDKGSEVSTENLVYDSETGDVIVNRTNNEFKQPIYTTNYPAWWAYSGMGPAYRNIDAVYTGVNFRDGKITSNNVPAGIIESGDELYIYNQGTAPSDACALKVLNTNEATESTLWAFDKNKNNSSLTNNTPDFYFMDKNGKLFSRNAVSFKIVRSGKRNLLRLSVASVTSMTSPIVSNKLIINNASKVINGGAVVYKEKWQNDNDIFNRFITVNAACTTQEVLNCAGYLEKNINPYRKGLLGNFRADYDRVFYAARSETSPLQQTNLPDNGFLSNFKCYWDFNAINNLVPDESNTNWVFKSKVNKYNAKGMELETVDALNIYTAAQYGFNKSMPVSVTQNAGYGQSFAESFEDNNYVEGINPSVSLKCIKNNYIDFNEINNASIVEALSENVSAHTGKSILKIERNSEAVKPLTIKENVSDFNLLLNTDASRELTTEGITTDAIAGSDPVPNITRVVAPFSLNFTNGTLGAGFQVLEASNSGTIQVFASQYIDVSATGTYSLSLYSTFVNDGGTTQHNCPVQLVIWDLQGNIVFSSSLCDAPANGSRTDNFYLCKGIYKVTSYMYTFATRGTDPGVTFYPHNSGYDYSISGAGTIKGYKDYSTVNGCAYTKPIPATSEMLNSTFMPFSSKKMLFSAWVRESCITPCTKNDYTNSNIEIWSSGSNIGTGAINRTGPIIEGWQKIEGEFTVPQGASSAEIRFINNNTAPMYVDDIRIHPYNANMKSYIYDPVNLRLVAELDANNYASFYEYDDEGTLIRTKAETKEGIKTLTETRSAKQRSITGIQP